ncbi:hypothetical protein TraAM80_03081 [Trypanosoma rangeli]|uniref:Integral membrane bound transporter domain-containing protein n=1 Tax=Trypanosoma rangeli TaxID=5698 RepID=A0A3R7MLB2_TRYRA|nr:uncharacterized protein TraAM80_03081 [Trypanosoma rangeli]RNF07933.1 hypothetical protein TraAM80_03081 [Trypanosoma rangeli]|eukprot:RNF07933.1 hypothetical protein TraAM80_03081 [Trypanosoma rangeli]
MEGKRDEAPMPGFHPIGQHAGSREGNEDAAAIHRALHSSEDEMPVLEFNANKGNCSKGNVSFGLPPYVPRYPLDQRCSEGFLNVPWDLRKPTGSGRCDTFDWLRSRKLWRHAEFALRITLLAVLLPASLIAAELPNLPFVSTTYSLSAAVLASKITVGEGVAYLITWIRAGCIWLPLATIGAAFQLGNSTVGWCFFYTLLLFVMATLTENMVRRICLLLFNGCMMGILIDPKRGILYPSQVMTDWCIGTGLCLLATFLPYPVFCNRKAQSALSHIAQNIGTALTGMSSCFWSESNVKRNMAMTKVRIVKAAIDTQFDEFYAAQENSFYEFIFEGFEAWDVRETKAKLFARLGSNLGILSRVLDIVESKPWVVDDSARSIAFGDCMHSHILSFTTSLDNLTNELASANTFGKIKQLHSLFLQLNEATLTLQVEFDNARRALFYENKPDTLEDFVPLMTFFIFSIINFRDTLLQFDSQVHHRKSCIMHSITRVMHKTVWEPINENFSFFRRLVTQWRRRELQRLIEAAKVSAAMILTVGFSFLINIDRQSISGPNIIAFVSGANPVEALQASIVRLTACILGTVLGFFAGSYSTTSTEKVASLCVLMFVGTFFRSDKQYGIMAVFAMFVLIPLNTVSHVTTEDTVARMNQITFGMLIYVFISVLVFPLSPGLILRKKRINVLLRLGEVFKALCDMFSEPPSIGGVRSRTLPIQDSGACDSPNSGTNVSEEVVLTNTSTRLVVRTDRPMLNINLLLEEIEERLKATYPFMGFAREERGLVDADYPAKSCEKTSYHLHRMMSLLKTMWCSWNVLRGQVYYTPDTRHILKSLQPIGWDACCAFQRFIGLLCYTLRNPATALEMELTHVVLELIQATEELHLRKNQMMLSVICHSVEKHGRRRKEPDQNAAGGAKGVSKLQKKTKPITLGTDGMGWSDDAGSVLTLLRKGTKPNLQESAPSVAEAVSLSESFSMPLTGEDAEGFHSLTLSMQMFADETKLLLMSLEEMLEHSRKTM